MIKALGEESDIDSKIDSDRDSDNSKLLTVRHVLITVISVHNSNNCNREAPK